MTKTSFLGIGLCLLGLIVGYTVVVIARGDIALANGGSCPSKGGGCTASGCLHHG